MFFGTVPILEPTICLVASVVAKLQNFGVMGPVVREMVRGIKEAQHSLGRLAMPATSCTACDPSRLLLAVWYHVLDKRLIDSNTQYALIEQSHGLAFIKRCERLGHSVSAD